MLVKRPRRGRDAVMVQELADVAGVLRKDQADAGEDLAGARREVGEVANRRGHHEEPAPTLRGVRGSGFEARGKPRGGFRLPSPESRAPASHRSGLRGRIRSTLMQLADTRATTVGRHLKRLRRYAARAASTSAGGNPAARSASRPSPPSWCQ